jgi:hypothetical protein
MIKTIAKKSPGVVGLQPLVLSVAQVVTTPVAPIMQGIVAGTMSDAPTIQQKQIATNTPS